LRRFFVANQTAVDVLCAAINQILLRDPYTRRLPDPPELPNDLRRLINLPFPNTSRAAPKRTHPQEPSPEDLPKLPNANSMLYHRNRGEKASKRPPCTAFIRDSDDSSADEAQMPLASVTSYRIRNEMAKVMSNAWRDTFFNEDEAKGIKASITNLSRLPLENQLSFIEMLWNNLRNLDDLWVLTLEIFIEHIKRRLGDTS